MQVEVRQSGIWQTNSTVLSADGACVVVDPAFFPRELDELVRLVSERGEAVAVAFTHGHWDHVAGWQRFASAVVWTSVSLAEAIRADHPQARQDLAALRDFDGRWYVERAEPVSWPPAPRPLGDGERVEVGGVRMDALHLPSKLREATQCRRTAGRQRSSDWLTHRFRRHISGPRLASLIGKDARIIKRLS